MGIHNLDAMFNPESIAVIGASDKSGSVGAAVMRNLATSGYKGAIYPINTNHSLVRGMKTWPSVTLIEKGVDLAIIATPISKVPGLVEDCGKAGIKGAVVISAGGKEIGSQGLAIEKEIKANADRYGLRIIGPNCLGIMATANRLNAGFAHLSPLRGNIAFLSQSGAVCTSILDLALEENVGFSYFVNLGSMMDVDFADMIDYLGSKKEVESIVMYVETISNIRNFMSAAREVSRVKPIIALKAGRSRAGALAAASHTGAMAGEDSVYDAAFKRAGILRVNDFEELFDCAEFLAKQRRPKGHRLGIVTNAGGPGVMAADALAAHGMEPAALSPETLEKLNALLPSNWSRSNPIDIVGDSSAETYVKTAEICINDPGIDGLLLICSPTGLYDSTALAAPLARTLADSRCPVFTAWVGGQNIGRARSIFNKAGIITFHTPERAIRTFVHLCQYGRNIEMLQEIPIRRDKKLTIDKAAAEMIIKKGLASPGGCLTEIEAKQLLESYGIPVNRSELAGSREGAAELADALGYPVAMKICSRDILHKSDAGGVALNLGSRQEVLATFDRLMTDMQTAFPEARIQGVTVQAMLPAAEYELILGAKTDRDFGPVLLVGMGGVLTEIFKDVAIALPPLNNALARRTMEETTIATLFKGYRNIKPLDMTRLEEAMIRISRLVTDFPEIQELDINPVLVSQGQIMAVDARVLVRPSTTRAPAHLVISSYPWELESQDVTINSEPFHIRPIRPEDAGLMVDLFESLSPKSIYMRFFHPVKELSKSTLMRLTQIDYDREVALIALMEKEGKETMVGVARIISEASRESGEFSVVVIDAFHGQGIGASLLKRCLDAAKARGMKKIWGIVLAENTQMLKLGRKLGFKSAYVPGTSEIELRIDLSRSKALM